MASAESRPATLTDFLLARIDEDEAWIKGDGGFLEDCQECAFGVQPDSPYSLTRILAECEAKRRIVEACEDCTSRPDDDPTCDGLAWLTLKHLALPYSDHPDYRDEWKP